MSCLANPYTNSAVNQADPVKLVEMLYSGAIRFARIAQRHTAASEVEPAHHAILRCYAIVAELMATPDFDKGGDIARNLEQCYDSMLSRLKDADMRKQAAPLDEVLSLQKRIRAVILDDSLEQLQQLMEEKQARLAELSLEGLPAEAAAGISAELQAVLDTEAALESLDRDRLMLMRTELRKFSEAGRA